LSEPNSGRVGTFRVSLLADWFSGSGFLCKAATPCNADTHDSASHLGSAIGLSVTPLRFLEAYASLRSFANSDDQLSPGLLEVLDDTTLGAKLFSPDKIAGLFSFGGSAELELLNGSGSVGLSGKGTSLRVLALAGADLGHLRGAQLPLRLTMNVGYFLDNSGNLVSDVESSRGSRITRVERFGLDINRVDQAQIGLGVEAIFPIVHPFLEWNLGVPVNRQNHVCATATRYSGDDCLADDGRLSAFPSTLTVGARFFPVLKGLSATAALDIGTSGTSNFIEELAPTLPWDLWLGVGYAFDVLQPEPQQPTPVVPPPPAKPTPKPALHARGFVHEKGKDAAIANAIVHYQGPALTAMATAADGHFLTADLPPGTYTFAVEAVGYAPGECAVVIPSAAPGDAVTSLDTDFDCELEALPRVGTVTGHAFDVATDAPIDGATVVLTDSLGRSLELATDGNGSFQFGNVLPGTVTVKALAPQYLFRSETVDVLAQQTARADLRLQKRVKLGLVQIAAKEIRLKRAVAFERDAATLAIDSTAVLAEVADALARTPGITQLEIQVHADKPGDATLAQSRANTVLDWLTRHGIATNRLTAHGDALARSPKVQLLIREQSAAP
jgi:outer membrane protein OmpA-like peptidoglycan-associated protein